MTDYQRIAAAIDYIRANFRAQPTLEQIAAQAHWSPFHFQRKFQQWAGVSPKKFLQYLSVEHAKSLLQQQRSVAEASYETGLSGSGRLHDLFVTLEAMTPGEYRQGGAALTIRYSFGEGRFGSYLVASTPKGICRLHFADDAELALAELRQEWPQATLLEHATPEHAQVARFFAREFGPADRLHLHLKGTDFQLKVWESLLRIPEGRLTTYAGLATAAGHEAAVRAVGTAIGANPVGYLIPCHRVIRQGGELGQYRWGASRKAALVGWEAAQLNAEPETA
ncbi:bifunctional transcriptional activator/DNA repair enzyme AdaA [Hymenobacter chitinivorans]|uniref:AraC family transcriptional regulator of adaptative response/methylated-DNA-[protein]-cysteine methyltransferase n=1 Tax=Hymenobacter chitinivorans DSM 11115 TaxID=1121954 RepID=A0A2M9BQ49_9BACT|nr:methylated-DNA--[protein]-cysteine S-methyltransferase [Hymenobacter chitinivorans]PJJ60086.1 AraC family transcriptional regulator of adaptative response/methylated-DNA-[protein]-cysteine methyltransferase [Hymenobacter chitinivorans DSM 11115]